MKNFWLDKKKMREEPLFIPMIDIGPVTWDFSVPPPEINIPPMVFGCIDIAGTGIPTQIEFPTEIKLVAPDLMPTINLVLDLPSVITLTGTAGPVGTLPLDIPSIITINSPEYRI